MAEVERVQFLQWLQILYLLDEVLMEVPGEGCGGRGVVGGVWW